MAHGRRISVIGLGYVGLPGRGRIRPAIAGHRIRHRREPNRGAPAVHGPHARGRRDGPRADRRVLHRQRGGSARGGLPHRGGSHSDRSHQEAGPAFAARSGAHAGPASRARRHRRVRIDGLSGSDGGGMRPGARGRVGTGVRDGLHGRVLAGTDQSRRPGAHLHPNPEDRRGTGRSDARPSSPASTSPWSRRACIAPRPSGWRKRRRSSRTRSATSTSR